MKNPSFVVERRYWQQGLQFIAGVDEVGMGALAGPVVAAAVVLPPECELPGVRDSKLMSPRQREQRSAEIKVMARAWAIGEASVAEITALNIRVASHLAMRRALEQLLPPPQLVLLDGRQAQPHPGLVTITIIDGDASCTSIAAASILAKVHRDALMVSLGVKFPLFGFAQHKGYGSRTHLAALRAHGPCPHHRPTYAPIANLAA